MSRLAPLLLLAACGGPPKAPPLPPDAPMPAGATWEGAWSTTFGEVTFVATGIPEGPLVAEYAFPRDVQPTTGYLYCNDADNHGDHHNLMVCATDVPREHVIVVMQPDGRSFVANWWLDHERWLRWEGQR